MKKINIYMSRLKYGGMELSLINFINNSNIAKDYEVNLYLIYVINKELLDLIDSSVKIHLLCKGKWNYYNKVITAIKLVLMLINNPKSDISICYSNHQRILSTLARQSSNNSILFIHSDLDRYISKEEIQKIKKKIKFDKFKSIICVSAKVRKSLINLYDESIKNKCHIVANYVDGDKIQSLANEKIKDDIDFKIPTFINIANHVEEYKNINAIIDAAYKLKKEKLKFQILLVGSGKDTSNYINKIKSLSLEKNIKVLGSKSNPYPYLKNSKALLFTSAYEGYGMVLDEARVLNIPIISTGSGASQEICKGGYGIITNDIASEIIRYIKSSKVKPPKFNYNEHNNIISKKYKKIIDSILK